MKFPEESAPAECYYNDENSVKYDNNSRIRKIQYEMTKRALELLEIDTSDSIILDLGCGTGISGKCIEENGFSWVGIDIAPSMLKICKKKRKSLCLVCGDIGQHLPFRAASFKYAISISVLQWLFHSYKSDYDPEKRINCFLRNLYKIIEVRCVLQTYFLRKQLESFVKKAKRIGFYLEIINDNPGNPKSKIFIILSKLKLKKKIDFKYLKKK